ncbi:MAG: penicillin-insensitive murein endopeptidase [Oligoflexia bacterium]|nr:penicillin-insensitive murein endopeptidase [Oligoflexia bacterium]
MKPIIIAILANSLFLSPLIGCAQKSDELTGKPQNIRQSPTRADDSYQGTQDQAIRFYSKGTLKSADSVSLEGFGYVKLFRPRERHYGTYDLTKIIETTSGQLRELYPTSTDRVQIGDMSDHDGGLQAPNHVSHQNGLDADIAFIRKNQSEQDPNITTGFEEIFVRSGKVTENFDMERNWNFVKLLVRTNRVQRIFVNPVIKKAFCTHAESLGEKETEAESLRRLRPYTGHMDHYHIRITCPENSPSCQTQEEIPTGTGC